MKSCFIQIGNTFTIQHKIIKRYLEKHLDNFIFDRQIIIPEKRDFETIPTEIKGREGITIHSFPKVFNVHRDFDLNLDYDVLFVNFVSRHAVDFTLFCDYVKRTKDVKIVVGGAAAGHFRDYLDVLLERKLIDHYVIGAGEKVILTVLQGKKIPKRVEMLAYPGMIFPDYETYEQDTCSLISMQSCPHPCTFCYESKFKPSILKPEILASWLKRIYKDNNITNFLIASCYFYDKPYFKRFYTKIENLIGKISFDFGYFKPSTIDSEISKMLKLMNFKRISLGIETFSDRLLNLMGKPNTVDDNIRAIECLIKENVTFWPERMFAYPTETILEFKESLKWFKKYTIIPKEYVHNYDLLSKNHFRLCPHTPLYQSDLVTINHFKDTNIMRCWHDNSDPQEEMFNVKMGILNDYF